jgi:hypothetical protein
MKKVFGSARDVIHLFAQRTQEEARCSNVFFEGDKIYSYGSHYLLGHFINDETIVINDTGWSATTNKHISMLKYATRQYKQFFYTEIKLDLVKNKMEELAQKLANAKKPELYIDSILYRFKKLNDWIEYSKKKELKKHDDYKAIKKIYTDITKNLDAWKDKIKIAQAKAKKAEKIRLEKALVKFMNYDISFVGIGNEDYLRISEDGTKVETTQGVKVSVESAKELYHAIIKGVDIVGHKIENYKVTNLNGVLTIGCHRINKESMHQIGKQLING